eukprot:119016_1
MTPIAVTICFVAMLTFISADVISMYPCVWKDELTGIQLDLQVFKSMELMWNKTANESIRYSPCSNSVNYANESYMAVGYYSQPVAIWDNGTVVPTFGTSLFGNYVWNFIYHSNIQCISNHSQQTTFNVTWTDYQCYNDKPACIIADTSTSNDTCTVSIDVWALLFDNCSLTIDHDEYSLTMDLHIFENVIFTANISSQTYILYSPCHSSTICNDYLAQTVMKTGIKNCTYLSLYSAFIYDNHSPYFDTQFDSYNQLWTIQYFTGQNCTEELSRQFYLYWQCNTLAKPYANVHAASDVICTEILSIDSIYACPDFQTCLYYDGGNMLNLTELVGNNIVYQNPQNQSSFFVYSVCQNALPNQFSFYGSSDIYNHPVTQLYNTLNYSAGIYAMTHNTYYQYTIQRVAGYFSDFHKMNATQYYYDSVSNAWIFKYTNGNLCDTNGLFTVQWNCGGNHMFVVESYTETLCVVMLALSTDLC